MYLKRLLCVVSLVTILLGQSSGLLVPKMARPGTLQLSTHQHGMKEALRSSSRTRLAAVDVNGLSKESNVNIIDADGNNAAGGSGGAPSLQRVWSTVVANCDAFLRRNKSKVATAFVILALMFGRIANSAGMAGAGAGAGAREGVGSGGVSSKRDFVSARVRHMYRRIARIEVGVEERKARLRDPKGRRGQLQRRKLFGTSTNSPGPTASSSAAEMLYQGQEEVVRETVQSLRDLTNSLAGMKSDILIPLLVTSVVIPVFKSIGVSPILGFLMMGTILGPSCLNAVGDVHALDHLGEVGIVFFLFEMGLELSIGKLMSMRKDVFGLGLSQFLVSSAVIGKVASLCGLSLKAAATVGGSLALSSSAFVLQLLKDKNAMGTRHGKASFGVLLLQDLAVVPLLIVVELLGRGGSGMGTALVRAASKAAVSLAAMSFVGKKLFDPIFYYVSRSNSQEAFLSITLCTVLLMSFVTEGIGLSGTLGAFLAGLLLAETRFKYQIEADIKPFRGILLGFFFITVGFSIDLDLIWNSPARVAALTAALLGAKAAIVTGLSMIFGISFASALQTGLLLSQGGEFAFVAFGIASRAGLLGANEVKMLLTSVALSMAATPFLGELGGSLATRIEQRSGFSHYSGDDSEAEEIKKSLVNNNDFVIVCGYGRIGEMVCSMLDRRFIRYVALDKSPRIAIEARNKGLPVFYGDITRPEVPASFGAGSARSCIVTIDDMSSTNRAVISLRKNFPNLPLVVRAKDNAHKERLEKMFDNVTVMDPLLPVNSAILALPFGSAVLESLGVSEPEIQGIVEDVRQLYITEHSDVKGMLDIFRGPERFAIGDKSDRTAGVGVEDDAAREGIQVIEIPASVSSSPSTIESAMAKRGIEVSRGDAASGFSLVSSALVADTRLPSTGAMSDPRPGGTEGADVVNAIVSKQVQKLERAMTVDSAAFAVALDSTVGTQPPPRKVVGDFQHDVDDSDDDVELDLVELDGYDPDQHSERHLSEEDLTSLSAGLPEVVGAPALEEENTDEEE